MASDYFLGYPCDHGSGCWQERNDNIPWDIGYYWRQVQNWTSCSQSGG